MKEFSKSVNSWWSYCKTFDSTFFSETQCIHTVCLLHKINGLDVIFLFCLLIRLRCDGRSVKAVTLYWSENDLNALRRCYVLTVELNVGAYHSDVIIGTRRLDCRVISHSVAVSIWLSDPHWWTLAWQHVIHLSVSLNNAGTKLISFVRKTYVSRETRNSVFASLRDLPV